MTKVFSCESEIKFQVPVTNQALCLGISVSPVSALLSGLMVFFGKILPKRNYKSECLKRNKEKAKKQVATKNSQLCS